MFIFVIKRRQSEYPVGKNNHIYLILSVSFPQVEFTHFSHLSPWTAHISAVLHDVFS